MKRFRSGKRMRISIIGFLALFAPITITVICAVFAYEFVNEVSSGNKLIIAAVLFVIIAALAAVCTVIDYLRRRLTVERPAREISEATARISAGDFSVRLVPSHAYGNYDEYDIIKENLNKMTAELSHNAVMNKDFVSNVSHELKTPLAVMQSYAAVLRDGKTDGQERIRCADELIAASQKLSGLVTNILRLNKLEHQEILPDAVRTDLGEQVRECVLQYEEIIESKNIEVCCDIDDVLIFSSPAYLEIIWNNLLSNAVKFTGAGGKISVSVKKRGAKAEVCVSDTGCGISAGSGAHIFDKFYQGDTSHSKEGNGLGLSLVKRIIDLLGGAVAVESAEGEGSSFTVTLDASEQ